MNILPAVVALALSGCVTACVNYRIGHDVDNPTVMAAKTGQDCEPMVFGLGVEPSVTQAMKSGGITKIRAICDTNTSLLGIGQYCHVIVGA